MYDLRVIVAVVCNRTSLIFGQEMLKVLYISPRKVNVNHLTAPHTNGYDDLERRAGMMRVCS